MPIGEVQDVAHSDSDLAEAVAYIRGRQTPAGGFSYYRSWGVEEPAAADTYYAVEALGFLESGPERREDCLRWLHERQTDEGGYSSIAAAWYVTGSLARLSSRPQRDPTAWLAPYSERFFDGINEPGVAHEILLNLLRYIELRDRFAVALEPRHLDALIATLQRLQDDNGALPKDGANLTDSAIALYLMRAANLIADRRILEFARACEDETYGFRAATTGQSSSLEVLAGGVAILHAFGKKPAYPRALLNAVTACRHANGGFGRSAGAVTTLYD
ncbi:MAG: prenyltransferase/squalene oxidase repeat-containing protein, partial [Terriglobia bacterium]